MWARSPVIPDSKGGRWYQPGAVAWKTDVAAIPGVGAPGLPRDKVWTLAFYSSELRLRQSYVYSTRLHGATASLEVQLHDLLSASLSEWAILFPNLHCAILTNVISASHSAIHAKSVASNRFSSYAVSLFIPRER